MCKLYQHIICCFCFVGSRATATFRFGFIALDLISIILEDSGEYVCRVTSQSGCVESQALLSVTGKSDWQKDRFYNSTKTDHIKYK